MELFTLYMHFFFIFIIKYCNMENYLCLAVWFVDDGGEYVRDAGQGAAQYTEQVTL